MPDGLLSSLDSGGLEMCPQIERNQSFELELVLTKTGRLDSKSPFVASFVSRRNSLCHPNRAQPGSRAYDREHVISAAQDRSELFSYR